MQNRAAGNLAIVMPHVEITFARFSTDGKCLEHNVFERFARFKTVSKHGSLLLEFIIRHRLVTGFQIQNLFFDSLKAIKSPLVGRSE